MQIKEGKNTSIIYKIILSFFLLSTLFPQESLENYKNRTISEIQGKLLLETVKNYSLSELQNAEEFVFHLCDLSCKFIQSKDQSDAIRRYLDDLRSIRKERDDLIIKEISEKKLSRSYLLSLQAAKMLYRLAALQLVGNLFNEDFDGNHHRFFTKDELGKLFTEFSKETTGYHVEWKEIVKEAMMDFEAIPANYEDNGSWSFLLIYDNGLVILFSGDFKGAKVSQNDPRAYKPYFNKWLTNRKK